MPVKAGVRAMPGAFVLKKIRALLRSKLLQIPEMEKVMTVQYALLLQYNSHLVYTKIQDKIVQ